nr:unnamed protein product [Callosobruchus chinensis]
MSGNYARMKLFLNKQVLNGEPWILKLLCETYTSTTHEGDLTTGAKTVKFEKVTVKKTVRHLTSSTSVRQASTTTPSRTPSTEGLVEDSAYATHASKTSSTSSLRFPSDERLDWDAKEWERENIEAFEVTAEHAADINII